jgi:NADPH:quinone reductase-like Zn-dependent oxidoreductase
MKAVTLAAYGNADPLEVADIPEPKIGPDDVAPADAWAEVPAQMDLIDAAALPLILLTGAQLIEEAVRPREGDVIVVTGAVGSVGRTAVFVAQARGARVWAGVRTEQLAEAARLGADGVVALDGIADTLGGPTLARLFAKLKPGGTIGSVVGEPGSAKERGFVVRSLITHPDAKRLGALAQEVAAGRLVIPIARRFRFGEARHAQELAQHHAGGQGHPGRPGSHARLRTRCRPPTPLRKSPSRIDTGMVFVNRHQKLRVRSRALRRWHPRVREQEARAGGVDRRSRLTARRVGVGPT